jgi:hypothetical protein
MAQDGTAIQHLLPFCINNAAIQGFIDQTPRFQLQQKHRRVRSAPLTSQRVLHFSRHNTETRPQSASLDPQKQLGASYKDLKQKLLTLNWKTNVQLKKEQKNTKVVPQTLLLQWTRQPKLPKTLFEIRTPRRAVPHNHRSLLPHPPFSLQRPQPRHFFLRSA